MPNQHACRESPAWYIKHTNVTIYLVGSKYVIYDDAPGYSSLITTLLDDDDPIKNKPLTQPFDTLEAAKAAYLILMT